MVNLAAAWKSCVIYSLPEGGFSWDFLPLIINYMPYIVTPIPNASINDINNAINNTGQPDGLMTGSQNNAAILATSAGQVTPLPFPAPNTLPASWGPGYNGPTMKSTQGNAINLNGDIAASATLVLPGEPGNGALRAYLIYAVAEFGAFGQRKFVDLHSLLTNNGYTWSNAMDVTDRDSQGVFSIVGVGDQGPWLITFTAGALTPTVSCLCQAPWNVPALNSGVNPLYPPSIRINNSGNMALTWNNDFFFGDLNLRKTFFPQQFLKEILPENVDFGLVQSFNNNRVLLLQGIGMFSPTSPSSNNWMNSGYKFKVVGITLGTTQYKRFMNNNPDVLVGPGFDTPLHFLQSDGTKVSLTTYFTTPSTTPVYPTNATPVAINDNRQIVCLVQASTTATGVPVYNSVLLTPQ